MKSPIQAELTAGCFLSANATALMTISLYDILYPSVALTAVLNEMAWSMSISKVR